MEGPRRQQYDTGSSQEADPFQPGPSMGTDSYPTRFELDEAFALQADARDPLRHFRDQFLLPAGPDGKPLIYFCSHSLGLQPKAVQYFVDQELANWARLGVEGHFEGQTSWYTYPELLRGPAARLLGALPVEVVFMNGLTVNLHLMMATFYRPNAVRYKVLLDAPVFPSDHYAVKSQLRQHRLAPDEALLLLGPPEGEHLLHWERIEETLARHGREIALVLWSGVHFLTGQCHDMARLTSLARQQGCVVGFDLSHAAGNVPLQLHDWDVDFAVWCNYKYLNSGPGAVAGCFVHRRHGRNLDLPRLAGWWGNDPDARFRMQLEPEFIPQPGAGGWQISNPPILALAPIRAALALYEQAGMPALRAKSIALTGYLHFLLDALGGQQLQVITPRDPAQRGCQLSLLIEERPRELLESLKEKGMVADFREPNIIRVAPVPFYNTFHEVWRLGSLLAQQLGQQPHTPG
jgi:kynureninase